MCVEERCQFSVQRPRPIPVEADEALTYKLTEAHLVGSVKPMLAVNRHEQGFPRKDVAIDACRVAGGTSRIDPLARV